MGTPISHIWHTAKGKTPLAQGEGGSEFYTPIEVCFSLAWVKLPKSFTFSIRTAAVLLPLTTEDVSDQLHMCRDSPGLRVRVWNSEDLRKQNEDNARCACWVLRKSTDPKAVDSDVRLAGIIRWFDGDSNHDPPYDLIVSTFEAYFDSTKQLYPGMRDWAYFSARAILQINMRARARSPECASRYPIPAISSGSFQHTDPDLHNIICMLEHNFSTHRLTLNFPSGDTNAHAHSLWMSNLFVDSTHAGQNPTLESYESYLSAAVTDHRSMDANILLLWYMFLGGHVEEESSWAVDKLYVVVLLSSLSARLNIVYASGSLQTILSNLSTRVMSSIADRHFLHHLIFLLEFLAAWEKRPVYLTPMAYQWCSAISEAAGRLGPSEMPIILPDLTLPPHPQYSFRFQSQDLHPGGFVLGIAESGFSEVGPGCDPVRSDVTSHTPRHLQHLIYPHLLSIILNIGFRRVASSPGQSALHLDHTSHHEWVFETAFSSKDEVIADAVCQRAKYGHKILLFSSSLTIHSLHFPFLMPLRLTLDDLSYAFPFHSRFQNR